MLASSKITRSSLLTHHAGTHMQRSPRYTQSGEDDSGTAPGLDREQKVPRKAASETGGTNGLFYLDTLELLRLSHCHPTRTDIQQRVVGSPAPVSSARCCVTPEGPCDKDRLKQQSPSPEVIKLSLRSSCEHQGLHEEVHKGQR